MGGTFTPDGTFTAPGLDAPVRGRAALAAAVEQTHARLAASGETHRHWHGMVWVTPGPDGTAHVKCYGMVIAVDPAGTPASTATASAKTSSPPPPPSPKAGSSPPATSPPTRPRPPKRRRSCVNCGDDTPLPGISLTVHARSSRSWSGPRGAGVGQAGRRSLMTAPSVGRTEPVVR
ncbi:nuclear transport factor 2 family protein [Catellatospora bangladeshensis]|uniref:nuclear transport factor 2 family protein n=1 Tax=Catellatospora bangladeshensis TaxID=310355 RepID=UPI0036234A4D